MQWLRQSAATTVKLGPFVDDVDGVTVEDGLTIAQADIRLSKNGGAFAQTNNSAGATHDENGYYGVPLDTTDTATLGRLRVAIRESGALPVWQDFLVVPANVYDSLVLGTDTLNADMTQISGDSTAADNAEAFFDGTGYAGTNNVIPTVTNLTNAPTNGDLTAAMKASVNTEVDTAMSDYGALKPTTAGRTLDVTATGAAGIDWGNIENKSTTNILTFTSIFGVTGNIGGSVTGSVGSVTAAVTVGTNNDKTGYSLSGTLTTLDALWTKIVKIVRAVLRSDAATTTDSATEITEINADGGSGAGDYSNATDSQEALRDQGDAAWVTATGFSTLDADGIRDAVGLASANLDTQLADLPTTAEFEARTLVAANYATAAGVSGISLTITPVQVQAANPRVSTRVLAPVIQYSAPTDVLTVTDGTGTAINLSGKTLRMVVAEVTDAGDEDDALDDTLAALYKYETGSGLTIGGASSNQVTIQHDADNTTEAGRYRYWLWNITDGIVLVKGTFNVEPALINT